MDLAYTFRLFVDGNVPGLRAQLVADDDQISGPDDDLLVRAGCGAGYDICDCTFGSLAAGVAALGRDLNVTGAGPPHLGTAIAA